MDKVQFTRKPFVLDGARITLENVHEIASWCKGKVVSIDYRVLGQNHKMPAIELKGNGPAKDKTFTGRLGDWVVEHKSSFRIYKPAQLEALFDVSNEFDGFDVGDQVAVVGDAPEEFAGLTGVVVSRIGRDEERHSWKVSVRFEPGGGSGVCLLTSWLVQTGTKFRSSGRTDRSPDGVLVLQHGDKVYQETGVNLMLPNKSIVVINDGRDFKSKGAETIAGQIAEALYNEESRLLVQGDDIEPVGNAEFMAAGAEKLREAMQASTLGQEIARQVALQPGDLAETLVKHHFDGLDIPTGTTVRVTVVGVELPDGKTGIEVLFSDGHYHTFEAGQVAKI